MAARNIWRAGAAVAACLALVAQVSSASLEQNDAGSGVDAGSTFSTSIRTHGFGNYEGNLTESDGSDWYRVKVTEHDDPVCLRADVTAPGLLTSVHLIGVHDDVAAEVVASPTPLRTAYVGLASEGILGSYLAVSARTSVVGTAGYTFRHTSQGIAQLGLPDAGRGVDAGATSGTAAPLMGACTSGTLDPAAGDTRDVYRFDGNAGDRILVSVSEVAGSVALAILSPTGDLLGSTSSSALLAATLSSTGTYYLSTTSSTATSYLLGLCSVDCRPPEQPCEPSCINLLAAEG